MIDPSSRADESSRLLAYDAARGRGQSVKCIGQGKKRRAYASFTWDARPCGRRRPHPSLVQALSLLLIKRTLSFLPDVTLIENHERVGTDVGLAPASNELAGDDDNEPW
jgi:hypothetical protein